MSKCEICAAALKDDLFAMVCQELVCCICKQKYIGGLPTSSARIAAVREALGLEAGKYLDQDNAAEAARMLGRKP